MNTIYNILSCDSNQFLAFVGKIATNTFEPSSGGSGIKLNTPKPTFIDIMYTIIVVIISPVCEIINAVPPKASIKA